MNQKLKFQKFFYGHCIFSTVNVVSLESWVTSRFCQVDNLLLFSRRRHFVDCHFELKHVKALAHWFPSSHVRKYPEMFQIDRRHQTRWKKLKNYVDWLNKFTFFFSLDCAWVWDPRLLGSWLLFRIGTLRPRRLGTKKFASKDTFGPGATPIA